MWSQIDERSAGFFALGIGKPTRRSGGAGLHLGHRRRELPARGRRGEQSAVPLIALTADRPPELRDWGAPQTIDQLRLFGPYVRWFAELPPPEASAELVRHARALGARAVAVATARAARARCT